MNWFLRTDNAINKNIKVYDKDFIGLALVGGIFWVFWGFFCFALVFFPPRETWSGLNQFYFQTENSEKFAFKYN